MSWQYDDHAIKYKISLEGSEEVERTRWRCSSNRVCLYLRVFKCPITCLEDPLHNQVEAVIEENAIFDWCNEDGTTWNYDTWYSVAPTPAHPSKTLPVGSSDLSKASILIKYGTQLNLNCKTLTVKILDIQGTLLVGDDVETIEASSIRVGKGGVLSAGTPDEVFHGKLNIILNGEPLGLVDDDEDSGNPMMAKSICVYGYLELVCPEKVSWTQLKAGEVKYPERMYKTQIATPNWDLEDRLIITATDFNEDETEVYKLLKIKNYQQTVEPDLKHNYRVQSHPRAKVGNIDRCITIKGRESTSMHGPQVVVGSYAHEDENGQAYINTGRATLEYVAIQGGGKRTSSPMSESEKVAAMTFSYLLNEVKSSVVKGVVFEASLGPSLAVVESVNVDVSDCVFWNTTGPAAVFESVSATSFTNNLIAGVKSAEQVSGNNGQINIWASAAVEAMFANELQLEGNAVVGAGVGFRVHPSQCDESSADIKPNEVVAATVAVMVLPTDTVNSQCNLINHYRISKSLVGIYVNSRGNYQIKDVTLYSNKLGIFMTIISPDDAHYNIDIQRIQAYGADSPRSDNQGEKLKETEGLKNMNQKIVQDVERMTNEGRVLMIIPSLPSSSNGYFYNLFNQWSVSSSDPGQTSIRDSSFNMFTSNGDIDDVVLKTNSHIQDVLSEVVLSNNIWTDVSASNRYRIDDPQIKNNFFCESITCDGLRKVLIRDEDIGSTIFSDSMGHFGEEGYGLTEDNIPGLALAALTDGSLSLSNWLTTVNKGIYSDGHMQTAEETVCNAFELRDADTNFRLQKLVLKSEDADSSSRRIGPLLLSAKQHGDSMESEYIDFVAASSVHSRRDRWPFDRLNHFHAIAPTSTQESGAAFDVSLIFNGSPPQEMSLVMPNARNIDRVVVHVHYDLSYRRDVYSDGKPVMSKNAEIDSNGRTSYSQVMYENDEDSLPTLSDDQPCLYVYDPDTKVIYLLMIGNIACNIQSVSTTYIRFTIGGKSVSDFQLYLDHLIDYLVIMLKIPPNQIRKAEISAENEGSNRKRRDVQSEGDHEQLNKFRFVLEFINPADIEKENEENSGAADTNGAGSTGDNNAQEENNGEVTGEEGETTPSSPVNLKTIETRLVNLVQSGQMAEAMNSSDGDMEIAIAVSLPVVGEDGYENITQSSNATYSTVGSEPFVIPVPREMLFETSIISSGVEAKNLPIQPVLKIVDSRGRQITALGTAEQPWQVKASLRVGSGSSQLAVLEGTLQVTFIDGFATFTDLSVSHLGSGYIIDFRIVVPEEAENFTVASIPLTVTQQSVMASIVDITTDVTEGETFAITVELQNPNSGTVLPDISWSDRTWQAAVWIDSESSFLGTLNGTTTCVFDSNTKQCVFDNVFLTSAGRYILKFVIESDHAHYSMEIVHKVDVDRLPESGAVSSNITKSTTKVLTLKIDGDYDVIVAPDSEGFAVYAYNYLLSKYQQSSVDWVDVVVSRGSVIIEATVLGTLSGVNATMYGICDSVRDEEYFLYKGNNLTFTPYLAVDGEVYSGKLCGEILTEVREEENWTFLIVGAAAAGCLLFLGIFVCCMYYCKQKSKKQKTADDLDALKIMGSGKMAAANGSLFYDNAFMSSEFYPRKQAAPADTNIPRKPSFGKGLNRIGSQKTFTGLGSQQAAEGMGAVGDVAAPRRFLDFV
ncbi:hypothetical protein ScPMuIL_002365 [Solemya velum]